MISRILVLLVLSGFIACQQPSENIQRQTDFNFDWKFQLQKDTTALTTVPLDDTDWRKLRLPHDWSIEASFDSLLEGCTGYLPGGVGVYQKHFQTPADRKEKSTFILFDGVYNNATFWLNGHLLGENPYGYSPVYFDLTEFLNEQGQENVLTVHVDHSRYADSRWYSGSGIYRNVKLITVNKLHIPIWGTYLTTPEISEESAKVHLETKIVNQQASEADFTLSTRILNASGIQISKKEQTLKIAPSASDTFTQELNVSNPKLWDVDDPNMYIAVTSIIQGGKTIDEYTTPFGIRSLKHDLNQGFFLNGKRTDIKGVCLHHAAGLVGAAVPKGVWRRRLEDLKKGGVNAIRTAHNPYSEEFYDLCDEMGFLVQNEIFDELDYPKDKRMNYHDRIKDYITRGYTEHFQEWGKSDLTRTMLRDRNHPSVFEWSVGNEIEWTYLHYRYVTGFWEDPNDSQNAGGYWGSPPMFSPEELKQRYDASEKEEFILAETAKRVNDWIKELDTTRVTTANLVIPQVSHVSGYADAVDIAGYSYRNSEIDWALKHFPHKQITINECPGSWDDWLQVIEHPGVYGIFMWTGISYLGETNGKWPKKDSGGDMLDLAGFKRQGWNYFKSIWVDEPHISLGTLPLIESGFKEDELSGKALANNGGSLRWRNSNEHWNYKNGEPILVEVSSNFSTVELLLNGRSLGRKSMSETENRIFKWIVPFEEGVITAKGGFKGNEVSSELKTTTPPVGFTFTVDKTTLQADAYDVAHFVVQLIDKDGLPVKTENVKIEFEIQGDARLLGVDNGADNNTQKFQSNSIFTDQGRCLMILQSKKKIGKVKVLAKAEGFEDQEISLRIK